jgi:O-antigen ligase
MLFSGTRAAFILPPAGLIFYALITFKKKVLYSTVVLLLVGIVIINVPSSNANIVRLQSAFNPTNDASYQVRVKNQAFIKPYIQKHPLGGGLGSVGEWGKKFSPWSPLANFPPDSGYIRVAVEEGWFGLLLYVTLLFVVFYSGIKDYFRIRDPELKTYALGMLTVFYSLVIANFPQEAIGQYPINILFFVAIAIINKCRKLDEENDVEQARLV